MFENDTPPPGHPAWDRPPVKEPDGWEPLDAEAGAVLDADASAIRTIRTPKKGAAPVLACDVPWLHPEVPAYPEPSGGTALLCPYCGRQHRHGGFGHRLAHCADPRGRGYVLVQAGAAPPWAVHPAPAAASDMELRA